MCNGWWSFKKPLPVVNAADADDNIAQTVAAAREVFKLISK